MKPTATRTRPYVGMKAGQWRAFRSPTLPRADTHGGQFAAVIGPFRTMRGARYMAAFGEGNPHLQTVADAERIAATPAGRDALASHRPTVYGYDGAAYSIGDRVELHPGTASRARYGTVRGLSLTPDDRVRVELDNCPGRMFAGAATTFKRID